ncbi:MAG: NAD(P)/FAD-dependent oxidoreductase [Phyllobacterium sp.]
MKITIVGGGIAGLSSAWSLTKAGHAVTLIEQGPIPNPLAASGDHHRIIRRAYGAAGGYADAISEAYGAWDELWQDIGARHLDPRGFICISREAGDEAETFREGLESGNYPLELYEPQDAGRRYAYLQEGTFRYAFFSPEGGALHCRHIATDMARWLREKGAVLLENMRVTGVDCAAGSVALADGTIIAADQIIIAAGAWVLKLFPDLGTTLTTYRTALAYLEPPADLQAAWQNSPVVLDVGGRTDGYVVPASGGGGLKFGSGLHKRRTPDADLDRLPAKGEGEAIRDRFAPPLKRLAEYRVTDVVTCAYKFTAEERIFASQVDRCLVVSACSGHGYKFGAAVGRRVAQAIGNGDVPLLQRWLRAEAA